MGGFNCSFFVENHLLSDENSTWDFEHVRRALIVVQWAQNWTDIAFTFYFINRLGKTALIHPNMRLTLTWILVLPHMLMMFGRMGDQLNESAWLLEAKSKLFTNVVCFIFRFLLNLGNSLAAQAILLLAIERLLATVFCRTYEVRGAIFAVALILISYAICAMFSIVFIMFDIGRGYDISSDTRSCTSDELHPLSFVAFWILATVDCNVGIGMMGVLYWWNKQENRNSARENLRIRYQYSENIATIRALINAFIPYEVLACLGLPFTIYISINHELITQMNIVALRLFIQVVYVSIDMYALIVKLLFLYNYSPLRAILRRDMRRLYSLKRANVSDVSVTRAAGGTMNDAAPVFITDPKIVCQTYFDQLDSAWQMNDANAKVARRNKTAKN